MKYTIKAHETEYRNVLFRSRLEARWACFFDLVDFYWEYEPVDLPRWTPDFYLRFPCGHSECSGSHSLLCEVKPYRSISDFAGHECTKYEFGVGLPNAGGAAALGINPLVSEFCIGHGAGGGFFDLAYFLFRSDEHIMDIWNTAGNAVRFDPRRKK